ncbi:MAG: hypothetical protein O3B09_03060 [Proteobacteria bacterium]|nr:hypothetical protein [Pseudomonadota bacterium]
MRQDRNIIQFQPDCAQYDAQLTYKLKEGSCLFSNREFSVKYDINKMGVRDDNDSLIKPEVIVLGDSFAMGWGVDNDEIFPSLIEKESGLKVLNGGISSYGTARESLLLKKLDVSNLKYLIIQYCDNDDEENSRFINNGFQLDVSSKEKYEEIVDDHHNRFRYKPFYYSYITIKSLSRPIRRLFKKRAGEVNLVQSSKRNYQYAASFINILQKMVPNIGDDVKIISFEMRGANRVNSDFYESMNYLLNQKENANLQDRVVVFDSSKLLTKEDYFTIDDHIRNEGHKKISDKILQIIE